MSLEVRCWFGASIFFLKRESVLISGCNCHTRHRVFALFSIYTNFLPYQKMNKRQNLSENVIIFLRGGKILCLIYVKLHWFNEKYKSIKWADAKKNRYENSKEFAYSLRKNKFSFSQACICGIPKSSASKRRRYNTKPLRRAFRD
jgi:hypothetical protein